MKSIFTFIFCVFIYTNGFAQRNPNTNAGKIFRTNPVDSNQRKQNNTNNPINQNNQPPANDPFSDDGGNKIQLGAALNYGNTINAASNLENGIGFSFKLEFNLLNQTWPISLHTGLAFDYLYFGGKKITQTNNTSVAINSNAYGWYPYVDLDLGSKWPITPFGTAYWGGRFFYTRQNINYTDVNGADKTDTKNIEGDATKIYGIGGGIKLKLGSSAKVELRYQKNYGNFSTVVDPNTIQFDSFGNLASYQNKNVDTDLDMFFMGITLCF